MYCDKYIPNINTIKILYTTCFRKLQNIYVDNRIFDTIAVI